MTKVERDFKIAIYERREDLCREEIARLQEGFEGGIYRHEFWLHKHSTLEMDLGHYGRMKALVGQQKVDDE